MKRKFIVLVTGWNCKPFIEKCYSSLLDQTYENFEAILMLDGPTDGSDKEILRVAEAHPDERIQIDLNPDNRGAALRRFEALQVCGDPTDIVLLLGMDDHLMPNALEIVHKRYQEGAWMTYGNWIDQTGRKLPEGFLDFEDEVHADRSYRKVKYRSTAPNTFYKFLFGRIPEEDFKVDGKWLITATETELMFSCLEMCGKDRIGVITDPIYFYNARLPNGTSARHGVEFKYQIYDHIASRQKRDLLNDKDFGL